MLAWRNYRIPRTFGVGCETHCNKCLSMYLSSISSCDQSIDRLLISDCHLHISNDSKSFRSAFAFSVSRSDMIHSNDLTCIHISFHCDCIEICSTGLFVSVMKTISNIHHHDVPVRHNWVFYPRFLSTYDEIAHVSFVSSSENVSILPFDKLLIIQIGVTVRKCESHTLHAIDFYYPSSNEVYNTRKKHQRKTYSWNRQLVFVCCFSYSLCFFDCIWIHALSHSAKSAVLIDCYRSVVMFQQLFSAWVWQSENRFDTINIHKRIIVIKWLIYFSASTNKMTTTKKICSIVRDLKSKKIIVEFIIA